MSTLQNLLLNKEIDKLTQGTLRSRLISAFQAQTPEKQERLVRLIVENPVMASKILQHAIKESIYNEALATVTGLLEGTSIPIAVLQSYFPEA